MHAVRRTLGTAGLAGFLLLAPTAPAWADPTTSADPSVTASASPAPIPSETTAPAPSDSPVADPSPGGCDQNPVICQSGGQPETTTDCDPFAASPPPSGVGCIAGGLKPGTTTTSGSGTPAQLPRTGPAPLVPTATVGLGLVLLGVVAGLAGRRRTARI